MPDLTTYEYDIFLSHNHADQEWTTKLAERLEGEDWQGRKLKVFFSPWDIRPGQSIPGKIEKALPKSRKVGLILSPEGVDSAWVELERLVTTYIAVSARDERLIPLYRRDCEIPALLQPILYLDFRDAANFEAAYLTLLSVIREEPLPRRSFGSVVKSAALHPLIPRPPIVGFVARRDSEGRDILARLQEELSPGKNQLIALSGPGGVGKTTLAAETARVLSNEVGGRIVWTSALGRDDYSFSTLLDEIATQLGQAGLRTLAPEPKAEQVQALLASAPTHIILDNFEPIRTEEQTRCVEFLLNRASCPTLITTRQKIPSARNITISVMSPEEADTFLQLLIDQSSDLSAFAQLDRDRIMEASERNPLVLQWVMGQIDLAQEPGTVLDELAQGVGDAAQRVFNRSFELEQLGDDGRAALLALSLFAPDASRPALAYVAGFGEDVKRLNEAVKHLAGLWLVKTALGGSRLTVEGLTRELAKARLTKDDRANEFRQRFVAHFADYAEAHSQSTPEDYDSLETEKDNLVIATDLAMGLGDWGNARRIVNIVANPATGVFAVHGYWDDAVKLNKQALEASHRSGSESAAAVYAHNLAIMLESQGELEEGRLLYHESLEINKRLGNQVGIAATLHQLAVMAGNQGELDEARRLYNESLEIEKGLGNQGGIASSLHELARLAQGQGELEEARRLYSESQEIDRKLGNQGGVASSLHQLAQLAQDQGELEEARRLYNESLEIMKRLGDQGGIANSLHELARLAQGQGDLDEARRLYNESLEIKKRLGDQGGIATSLHNLAALAQNQGDLDEARRLYNESLEIAKRLGNQGGIASSLHELARLAQNKGELDEARRLYNESFEIKKRLGDQDGIALTFVGLGMLAEGEGNNTDAAKLFGEALAIFEKLRSPIAGIARASLERVKGKST